MKMILNKLIYSFIVLVFHSSLFGVSNEGMSYLLSINKNEIQEDEIIKVDTRDKRYIERIK